MNAITEQLGQQASWLVLRQEKSHPANGGTWEGDQSIGMESWLVKPCTRIGLCFHHDALLLYSVRVADQKEGRKCQTTMFKWLFHCGSLERWSNLLELHLSPLLTENDTNVREETCVEHLEKLSASQTRAIISDSDLDKALSSCP